MTHDRQRTHHPSRDDWQSGPTGPAPTTESVGDHEADDLDAGTAAGAAGGAVLGVLTGGPPGAVAGAVIGAAAGAAGEAADRDADRGYERRQTGTAPADPITEMSARPEPADHEEDTR